MSPDGGDRPRQPVVDLSPQQLAARARINAWRRNPVAPFFYLDGPAGAGKTTLIRSIAADVGGIVFGAYTGRAAGVMRRKGCAGATTLDKLVYRHSAAWRCGAVNACTQPPCDRPRGSRPRDSACPNARLEWHPKIVNRGGPVSRAGLVIVDESSMLSREIGRDLIGFGRPVLMIGDRAQLPPVSGDSFLAGREPDACLTQVHRQAEGNPIIALATLARQGRMPAYGAYGRSQVVAGFDGDLTAFDVIICGRNDTRRAVNRKIRRQLGFGELPVVGEPLICLRNQHEIGVMNGEFVTVLAVGTPRGGLLPMSVETEDGASLDIKVPLDLLLTDCPSPTSRAPGVPVAWAYAVTAHKAQGGEWENVLVFDQSGCFGADRWRWLYTAISRAAERVTVVRPGDAGTR